MKTKKEILRMNGAELREYMLSEDFGPIENAHPCQSCNSCNSCNVKCGGCNSCYNCEHCIDCSFCRSLKGTKENPKRYHICNVPFTEIEYRTKNRVLKELGQLYLG